MTRARLVLLLVGLIGVVLFTALFLQPTVREVLAPTPTSAWVGIEVDSSGEAVLGPVDIIAGTPFRLHAVLEARGRGGEAVYYTEAPALRVNGETVGVDRMRRWNLPSEVKILWFTVEGLSPFVQLEEGQNLDGLSFQDLFHPDWPTLWQVDGVLDPRFDDAIGLELVDRVSFGTQRYQVWIEIFDEDQPFLPKQRFKSWGSDELLHSPARFPTVRATLPEAPLASAAFGLTQVEPPETVEPRVLEQISRRTTEGLIVSRLPLLRDLLGSPPPEDGDWQLLDLQAGLRWAESADTGDLIRVGARWVVLYRDAGEPGVIDMDDLCFDYEQGVSIRRLGEIFSGEGDVEWLDRSEASNA